MSKKVDLDKYYTPSDLSKYCINKTKEIIGGENISEYIEPSAGNGSFSLKIPNCIAYDIEPEHESIIKQDFLKLELPYKKGRLIIGNPPFGIRNTLSVQFYKKSYIICDYIAFILPISQYKNTQQMFEFDLVYTEVLKNNDFKKLDKRIKLCFNIYKRPKEINKKPKTKLKDINITEIRNKNKECNDYDIRICGWGWKIGQEVLKKNQFAKELCIKVNNGKFKKEVLRILRCAEWTKLYPMTGTENLLHWQIYKHLKEQIPELE